MKSRSESRSSGWGKTDRVQPASTLVLPHSGTGECSCLAADKTRHESGFDLQRRTPAGRDSMGFADEGDLEGQAEPCGEIPHRRDPRRWRSDSESGLQLIPNECRDGIVSIVLEVQTSPIQEPGGRFPLAATPGPAHTTFRGDRVWPGFRERGLRCADFAPWGKTLSTRWSKHAPRTTTRLPPGHSVVATLLVVSPRRGHAQLQCLRLV